MWFKMHKSLTMAIGIALVACMLVLIAVIPIYRSASQILRKISLKESELAELTNKVTILSRLDTNVLRERTEVLDKALPAKKDVLLYLSSIDGLSQELGLTFGGLSLSPGELSEASGSAKKTSASSSTDGLQRLETEITMRGSQESVYTFLRTIETVLPLMQIKNVKVSVVENDQYSLALTLAMLWADSKILDLKGKVTLFGGEEEKYFNQLQEFRRFESIANLSPSLGSKIDLFSPSETTLPQ